MATEIFVMYNYGKKSRDNFFLAVFKAKILVENGEFLQSGKIISRQNSKSSWLKKNSVNAKKKNLSKNEIYKIYKIKKNNKKCICITLTNYKSHIGEFLTGLCLLKINHACALYIIMCSIMQRAERGITNNKAGREQCLG